MAAEDNLSRQFPKRKRTMAFTYPGSGQTFCPSCHKSALTDKAWHGIEHESPIVKSNLDFDRDDMEVCSSCGKTIKAYRGERY